MSDQRDMERETAAAIILLNLLNGLHNEDPDTISILLEAETPFWERVKQCALKALEIEALADHAKERASAIKQREADLRDRAKRLRRAIAASMRELGQKGHDFPEFRVSVSAGQPAVEVIDEARIPAEYRRIKTTTDIDKAGLRKRMKAGQDIPGARLVPGTDTVRIR